jgi:ABC-type nitrate/sulfonate/bicarbonate transport system substrate-binding protein
MGELWLAMWADEHSYTQGEDFEVTFLGDETQYQTALASGSVDACYLDVSHPTYTSLEENVGVKVIHEMPRGDWVAAFVAVRQEWVEEEPEKLRRFLRAYKKAAEYARENSNERIENVAEHTSYSEEELNETVLPKVPADLSIDVEDLNQVQDLMYEHGMVDKDQKMDPMIYNDAIREVQQNME